MKQIAETLSKYQFGPTVQLDLGTIHTFHRTETTHGDISVLLITLWEQAADIIFYPGALMVVYTAVTKSTIGRVLSIHLVYSA
jgi:hypothetical protein